MAFYVQDYVATLSIRPSEMKGLEFLRDSSKERITPCFLLAPWVNSHALERAINKIENVFPQGDYFLDIDPNYHSTEPETQAQQELSQLRDPSKAYKNWTDFIENHERALPVIQTQGQNKLELQKQIESVQKLNRQYCLRISRDSEQNKSVPENFSDIIEAFSQDESSEYTVILEGGWTRNPLSLADWFRQTASHVASKINAQIPIVISCTSIPKFYLKLQGLEKITFTNNELISKIQKVVNNRIIYGDWGSTRPRELNQGGRPPIPRIDYPTNTSWHFSRNKEKGWTFKDAAKNLIANKIWNGKLDTWGEDMILNTSKNIQPCIDTHQKNIAARVNIHLYLQSFGGIEAPPSPDPEKWKD